MTVHRSSSSSPARPGVPPRALELVARAKVNLSLEVLRQRADGYHEIETVMQSIDLADRLRVEATDDGCIEIECAYPGVPTDERNLCHRAVVAMRGVAGRSLGARIRVEKHIPPGAGLGGGSADCAGVLLAIRRARRLDLADSDLDRIAAGLGSDVPFLLHGGTMLGRGRGERLTSMEPLKRGVFVVVKPEVSISTAWAYSHFNFRLTTHVPRINLRSANSVLARFPRASLPFRNALEAVVVPAYPAVAELLDELRGERPCFASMTGSGSAVFAVFDGTDRAAEVAERFSVRRLFTSVAKPAKQSIEFL